MGLLFADITPKGIIMGSDSQDLLIYNSRLVIPKSGYRDKQKIFLCRTRGFKGLLGYVGTEKVGSRTMKNWLEEFILSHKHLKIDSFLGALSISLTEVWTKQKLRSGLWLFIAGYKGKEEKFYYINNISSLDTSNGLYADISSVFNVVDDLDQNYIQPLINQTGSSKKDILAQTAFNFRNGKIVPFAQAFNFFDELMKMLINDPMRGFLGPKNLERMSFIARQRLEFVKRLYSKSHGIYTKKYPPIGGRVYIYSINKSGNFYQCSKNSFQKV